MLEQTLGFTGCSSIQFFNLSSTLIYPLFPNTVSEAGGVTYHLLFSACVTFCTLYYDIGYQVLPNQPLPQGGRGFPKGWQVFLPCASAHIANLLATKKYCLVGSIYGLRGATGYYVSHLLLVLNSLYQQCLYILLDALFICQAIELFSDLCLITVFV